MSISLAEIAKQYGTENMRFELEMEKIKSIGNYFTYSDGDYVNMEAMVDESRYEVADKYKITLVGTGGSAVGRKHFYQSDLESMIESGRVKFRLINLESDR